MSKLPQHIEKRFDERFSPEWWTSFGTTPDIDKHGIKGIKSFIATILEEATKEAWIEGFMTSAEGYNGEYLGSYLTKGRTIRETVIKDIYDSEHNLIKEDEKNNL